mgnify:CR=1 FL=1
MNFGAIVAMDACSAVIRLRTFNVLPEFRRNRRQDHSRLKRTIGHVSYDPIGPIWHSKAGRKWVLSPSDFEMRDELSYCDVCQTMKPYMREKDEGWTSCKAEETRQLFYKAAMLLDPDWIDHKISDDSNQNVLKLHSVRHIISVCHAQPFNFIFYFHFVTICFNHFCVFKGLDVSNDNISQLQEEHTLSSGRPIVQQFGEEEENNCPLMTGNDPNLGHVDNHGDVSNLIDLPHVKRAKFENDLDARKICAILLNEH